MATFYIATSGSASGDGSQANPWPTIPVALSQGGPGNTYIAQSGVYAGNISIPLSAAGTQANPTIIQSQSKYGAVLCGSASHGISTASNCDWLVLDGLEVLGSRLDGIKLSGNHCTIQNCWVHHNGNNGIGAHGLTGTTLTRNLVEYNGTNPQLLHGIYADGTGLTVTNNIVRHNASYGVHLYPALANSLIQGNLIYGQAARFGLLVACPAGGGQNRILGNTLAGNNYGGIQLNSGNGEIVQNNIVTAIGSQFGPYFPDANTTNTAPDYNLSLPAQASFEGSHGLSADPLYVSAQFSAYWLGTGSPAIGRANPTYLPATDFWGRMPAAADLGAFVYAASLTQPAARSTWYDGYPYSFTPLVPGEGLPDLWATPQ